LPGESKTIDMEIKLQQHRKIPIIVARSKIDGLSLFAEFMVMKSWC
jgi:hypothetical protein